MFFNYEERNDGPDVFFSISYLECVCKWNDERQSQEF